MDLGLRLQRSQKDDRPGCFEQGITSEMELLETLV